MFIICIGSPIFIFISFGIAIYTNKPFLWYLFFINEIVKS